MIAEEHVYEGVVSVFMGEGEEAAMEECGSSTRDDQEPGSIRLDKGARPRGQGQIGDLERSQLIDPQYVTLIVTKSSLLVRTRPNQRRGRSSRRESDCVRRAFETKS